MSGTQADCSLRYFSRVNAQRLRNNVVSRFAQIFELSDYSLFAYRLTAVALLLHGSSSWIVEIPITICCALFLLSSKLARSKTLWMVLSVLLVTGNGINLLEIDNHKFVFAYWTIGCCLSLYARDPAEFIQYTARVLVGLVFLFATIWKIAGGEYHDGHFIHYTILTDSRVEWLCEYVGQLTDQQIEENREMCSLVKDFPDVVPASLHTTESLRSFSRILSFLTLAGEGSLALCLLLPWRRAQEMGQLLLLGFIVVTYFFLPVIGFAFILAVLGTLQSRPGSIFFPMFLVSVMVVQFTYMPIFN